MSETLTVWRVYGIGQGPAYVEAETRTMAIAMATSEINNPDTANIVYEE